MASLSKLNNKRRRLYETMIESDPDYDPMYSEVAFEMFTDGCTEAQVSTKLCLFPGMVDDWCTKQHGASGLVDRVKQSMFTEAHAERETIKFLPLPKISPRCKQSKQVLN